MQTRVSIHLCAPRLEVRGLAVCGESVRDKEVAGRFQTTEEILKPIRICVFEIVENAETAALFDQPQSAYSKELLDAIPLPDPEQVWS